MKKISIFLLFLFLLSSKSIGQVDYTTQIQPIFDSNCALQGCHVQGHISGLNLTSYSNLMAGDSNNGPVVTPGDGANSVIIQKLRGTASFGSRMPFNADPLPDSTISLIETWIDEGAHEKTISIDNVLADFPTKFEIVGNFPNPFNPITTIVFDLPVMVIVDLVVYDVMGREVEKLVSGKLTKGRHRVAWDATNRPGGIYFLHFSVELPIQAAGISSDRPLTQLTNKMLLLK